MIKVLYAEDDIGFAKMTTDFLTNAGYKVFHALDGEEALKLYRQEGADVVLLDILMPGKTGFEVARIIREENRTVPILFISSLYHSEHAIEGYRVGGNDYIRKEVMLEEVCCRIESLLKQMEFREPDQNFIRLSENITLDTISRDLTINGVVIHLPPMEMRIMKMLFLNKNQYVDKEKLVMEGWGNNYKESFRYLDKTLVRLRKIIDKNSPLEISTSWGKGCGLMEKRRIHEE